jgi:NAD(P)-dependent dehydrogenase (short-subunit alcohol dehydrogenase family)
MPGLVQGKIVLVTGGGSGIGRATALKLAQEGATVMIADYIQEGGERTVKMIKDADGAASFIHTDVSIARKSKRWSRKPPKPTAVDGAFNNAGIEGHVGAITVECSEENFDCTIEINLKGVWRCMKYEIPQMLKRRSGSIVNTAFSPRAGRSRRGASLQCL